jgi:hypothetical protein
MTSITRLIKARAAAFEAYDAARETAFAAATKRDALKAELKAADTAIQNFLRAKLPT